MSSTEPDQDTTPALGSALADERVILNMTIARRARNRAAETAEDAAECARKGTITQARDLLAEADRHLDIAGKHERAAAP